MKIFRFVLLFVACLAFFGCAKTRKEDFSESAADEKTKKEKIDYDLSNMKPNMIYAQIFDMMVSPETYNGKIIKMKGSFEIFEASEIMGEAYSVIIYDALACCQQGIEFKYDFGENIPEKGSEITVAGKFIVSELESGISYNFVQADSVEF